MTPTTTEVVYKSWWKVLSKIELQQLPSNPLTWLQKQAINAAHEETLSMQNSPMQVYRYLYTDSSIEKTSFLHWFEFNIYINRQGKKDTKKVTKKSGQEKKLGLNRVEKLFLCLYFYREVQKFQTEKKIYNLK